MFDFRLDGDGQGSRSHRCLGGRQIFSGPDVADGNVIRAVFQGVLEGCLVFFSDGRKVDERARYVESLSTADGSAVHHPTAYGTPGLSLGGEHREANQTVCQQNGVAGLEFGREPCVFNGKIRTVGGFCTVLAAQQGDFAALVQHLNLGKRPQAKFWPGQISEDARGTTEFIFDVAKATVEVGFVLGFTVGVVEPTDVNARFHERHERRSVVASRPDGRHDSRASHRDHLHL